MKEISRYLLKFTRLNQPNPGFMSNIFKLSSSNWAARK